MEGLLSLTATLYPKYILNTPHCTHIGRYNERINERCNFEFMENKDTWQDIRTWFCWSHGRSASDHFPYSSTQQPRMGSLIRVSSIHSLKMTKEVYKQNNTTTSGQNVVFECLNEYTCIHDKFTGKQKFCFLRIVRQDNDIL